LRTDPRIGAHECQRIAERAFSAAEMYALGVRGRPRFKGKGRPLHSLEGKSTGSSLCWNSGAGCLEWGGMRLAALMPPSGKDAWLERGLRARTKFARVIWRNIAGERRWFVQLAQEGLTPLKYETVDGAVVGLDVGPSSVAVYSEQRSSSRGRMPGDCSAPWIARVERPTRIASKKTALGSAARESPCAARRTRHFASAWPRQSES
jgi:hypothetical protein